MFFDSVIGGLKALTYWQKYVAAIEFLILSMIPLFAFGYAMEKWMSGKLMIAQFVITPLLQTVAQVVFILTLWPIILGVGDKAMWSFPFMLIVSNPLLIFKIVGIAVLGAIILAFIPFFGRMNSLQPMLVGIITLGVLVNSLSYSFGGNFAANVTYWPGFWFFVGLFVIGGIVSWIALIIVSLAVTPLEAVSGGLGQLAAIPLAAIFGFIPMFMYGAWLGAKISGH